jgi:predicted ABC-type ATPase
MKDIVILGGPNGAGKSTAAPALVPTKLGIREFVNADEIAQGLSPFNDQDVAMAAGRLMLQRIRELIASGRSFAFETTCSGRAYARILRLCKSAGWRVTLLFLYLPTPDYALARVARRVGRGGHFIPDDIVVRRYWAGLFNLKHTYLPLADVAAIYDNSDEGRILIAERTPESRLVVHDSVRWEAIERAAP